VGRAKQRYEQQCVQSDKGIGIFRQVINDNTSMIHRPALDEYFGVKG
jgi:hypothetical protein